MNTLCNLSLGHVVSFLWYKMSPIPPCLLRRGHIPCWWSHLHELPQPSESEILRCLSCFVRSCSLTSFHLVHWSSSKGETYVGTKLLNPLQTLTLSFGPFLFRDSRHPELFCSLTFVPFSFSFSCIAYLECCPHCLPIEIPAYLHGPCFSQNLCFSFPSTPFAAPGPVCTCFA